MKFEQIIYPISKELNLIEQELINIKIKPKIDVLQEISDHFFKVGDKQFRPSTLVLLSAKAVNNKLSETKNYQLIQLAVFLELMHRESLIHDEVIDGDVIHSQAFTIICNAFPKEFTNIIAQLIETICATEIKQANECDSVKNKYYKVKKEKAALFMAISCELGATLAGGDNDKIISLEKYGYNLGMAYQILDDFMNDGINADFKITHKDVQYFVGNAITSIDTFENSLYKQSLINLVSYILNTSYEKVSSTL